ncbi:Elongator complex protein 5 [Lineolata rhizophorae]|uniref:Elongator complex protein 5 n=1 Tax=Lineolata rhizophorae TaxID=578093 RepID=A0A6A6NSU8_9PEZI|nr:Elongator complex protein 5 [Lineolata rhizophorae]
MAPSALEYRRVHNILLISKLFNPGENASPFTLIIDSLEQSGKPILREYVRRANNSKIPVILVSFETLRPPKGVTHTIGGASIAQDALHKKITSLLAASTGRSLIIFDTLHPLITTAFPTLPLPTFLSTLISPSTSILALYHADIPLPSPSISSPYSPAPLTLLKYLATTLITPHSPGHMLAARAARDRAIAAPSFGLDEDVEGALCGLGCNDARGTVLEVEYRRRSGRGMREWYFLPSYSPPPAREARKVKEKEKERVVLLDDHPLFKRETEEGQPAEGEDELDVTFSLGLTEKQRKDREGVVLPYFDAQKDAGVGEGGWILYEMGEEDDFDEEEDEI